MIPGAKSQYCPHCQSFCLPACGNRGRRLPVLAYIKSATTTVESKQSKCCEGLKFICINLPSLCCAMHSVHVWEPKLVP